MAKRKRRAFTNEFKAEAVRLVRESGKSVGVVARELDLTETALRSWARLFLGPARDIAVWALTSPGSSSEWDRRLLRIALPPLRLALLVSSPLR
jgi:transposase